MKRRTHNLFAFSSALAAILVVWIVVKHITETPDYILPSPYSVLVELTQEGNFYFHHLISTLVTSLLGLALGCLLGIVGAVLSILIRPMKPPIEAFAIILRTLPVVAMAPMITLWLGTGKLSHVAISTLICFFPMFSACLGGMERANSMMIALFRLYGATTYQVFIYLRIPHAIPNFLHAVPLTATLAVLGTLVAEFCGSDNGLGSLVLRGLYRLNAPMLYSANVLAAMVGVLFYIASSIAPIFLKKYITTEKITENSDNST